MAQVKISELPEALTALAEMQFEVNDNGVSRRISLANILDAITKATTPDAQTGTGTGLIDATLAKSAISAQAAPKPTGSAGVGQVVMISPASGVAYTVPAGGKWFVSAQQIGTGGSATLVQSRGVFDGGYVLATPGPGYAWTGYAWKVS